MNPLFGHAATIASLRVGLDSGRLHHAWLISGPMGIGKSLFANWAAARVLAENDRGVAGLPGLEVPEEHPAIALVAAGTHPDLLRLTRLPRDDAKEDGELARNIKVDQIRELHRFLGNTPAMSSWRVVIIDSAEDLEEEGANALLKNLEEPPPRTVFLIVSHAPDRLAPTIRSRCRQLRLAPLDDTEMAAALTALLPEAKENEIAELVRQGRGSPGVALALRGLDMEGLERSLRAIAQHGDADNARRSALAQSLTGKAAQPRYEAFLARIPSIIAEQARVRRGAGLGKALALWQEASELAGRARRLNLDPQTTSFVLAGMVAELAEPSRGR